MILSELQVQAIEMIHPDVYRTCKMLWIMHRVDDHGKVATESGFKSLDNSYNKAYSLWNIYITSPSWTDITNVRNQEKL